MSFYVTFAASVAVILGRRAYLNGVSSVSGSTSGSTSGSGHSRLLEEDEQIQESRSENLSSSGDQPQVRVEDPFLPSCPSLTPGYQNVAQMKEPSN